jgi:hypothetical protein
MSRDRDCRGGRIKGEREVEEKVNRNENFHTFISLSNATVTPKLVILY